MTRRHVRHRPLPVASPVPEPPVDAERGRLYTAAELYDTIDYAASLDARAHAWSRLRHTRDAARVRALHDFAIDEALDAWAEGRHVVGVMGGHTAQRGDDVYRSAARLGHALAQSHTVATGGGPGAMEAANLGAWLAAYPADAVDAAVGALSVVPGFRPSVQRWAETAVAVRSAYAERPAETSLGIPTWFYGHEPPNVFCDAIAKYFRNATREAVLVEVCDAGIVYLPGAGGTVQEIFQDACENYYADATTVAPMILLGREYWTRTLPAWPLLETLAHERTMAPHVHLADSVDEVAELLRR